MKQLFAILMSLHFMLQPLQGMAAETKEQSNDASGAFVSGTESSNPIYDGEISQLLDGYRLYAYQTLSFSTAIVGASIATMCGAALKVPSVAAFEVGSLAYVMKEIVDGKKQNAHHKEMLDKVKAIKERTGGMEDGDVQKEILSQHRDEELHKRDLIKSRVTWLKAVAVMYAAATGLAVGEEIVGMSSGMAAGLGACSAIAAELAT